MKMLDIVNKLRERTGREPIVPKEMTPEERAAMQEKSERIAAALGYEGIWREKE